MRSYRPPYATEYDYGHNPDYARRHSYEAKSHAGSHKSHRSSKKPALTERNLKTLSEASTVKPSKPPVSYHSPYAKTLPRGVASYADLPNAPTAAGLPRTQSETALSKRNNDIDMHLAYGSIPPDLATRYDLDPSHQAKSLVQRVEGLLVEAQCLQHSAGAIIKHLQKDPKAAAAVALTLAELSSAVSKMSPALLNLLRGGSPAVFSLLASPQFLIGTGLAVGATVVMFGGWKIVKRVKEAHAAREAMAHGMPRPALWRAHTEYSTGIEEALVVDEDLGAIETWRRGIMPAGGDDESAEIELITPGAERAHRRARDADVRSHRSARTVRSERTAKTTKSKTKTEPRRKGSRRPTAESVADSEGHRKRREPEKRESRGLKLVESGRSKQSKSRAPESSEHRSRHPPTAESVADSEAHRSRRREPEHVESRGRKPLEGGRSRRTTAESAANSEVDLTKRYKAAPSEPRRGVQLLEDGRQRDVDIRPADLFKNVFKKGKQREVELLMA